MKLTLKHLILCLLGVSMGLPFGGFIVHHFGMSLFSRLTFQDVFAIAFLISYLPTMKKFEVTPDILFFFLLVMGTFLSACLCQEPDFNEVIVHVYLFVFYATLRQALKQPHAISLLSSGLAWGLICAIATAIVGKVIPIVFLPQEGVTLQGSFRNSSQLGIFLLIVGGFYSLYQLDIRKISSILGPKRIYLCYGASLLAAVSLIPLIFLTAKKTALFAIIPLLAGIFVHAVVVQKKILFSLLVICMVSFMASIFLYSDFALGSNELEFLWYKVFRVVDEIQFKDDGSFLAVTWETGVESFLDNPFFGQGFGSKFYLSGSSFSKEWEIHSTGLKWAAEGGLSCLIPGTLFLFFIAVTLLQSAINGIKTLETYSWFCLFFYLLLVLISFYDYLPRKREFLLVVALIVSQAEYLLELNRVARTH